MYIALSSYALVGNNEKEQLKDKIPGNASGVLLYAFSVLVDDMKTGGGSSCRACSVMFCRCGGIPPRGDIPQPEPPEEVARILHKKKKELKKIKCYPISIDILPSPC